MTVSTVHIKAIISVNRRGVKYLQILAIHGWWSLNPLNNRGPLGHSFIQVANIKTCLCGKKLTKKLILHVAFNLHIYPQTLLHVCFLI